MLIRRDYARLLLLHSIEHYMVTVIYPSSTSNRCRGIAAVQGMMGS
jgi:hypothetical protein